MNEAQRVQARERQARERHSEQARADRSQHALRTRLAGLRRQRAAEHDKRDDEAQNAELELGQGGENGQDRGLLAVVLLELAQSQQEEDRADGVRLAPDGAVEPGDRVDDDDQGGDEGAAPRDAHLPNHDPDEGSEPEVGQHREQLHALADVAATQEADEAEQKQVDGRIVDEAGSVVEADGAVLSDVVAPGPECTEVVGEARPRQQNVCDDEAEEQTQGQENDDGENCCNGTTRSRRRTPLWAVLSRTRACQPWSPGRALRWSGV